LKECLERLDEELDEFELPDSELVCTGLVVIHILAANKASDLKASLSEIYT